MSQFKIARKDRSKPSAWIQYPRRPVLQRRYTPDRSAPGSRATVVRAQGPGGALAAIAASRIASLPWSGCDLCAACRPTSSARKHPPVSGCLHDAADQSFQISTGHPTAPPTSLSALHPNSRATSRHRPHCRLPAPRRPCPCHRISGSISPASTAPKSPRSIRSR